MILSLCGTSQCKIIPKYQSYSSSEMYRLQGLNPEKEKSSGK